MTIQDILVKEQENIAEIAEKFVQFNNIQESNREELTIKIEELVQKLLGYDKVESDDILFVTEIVEDGKLYYDTYFYKNSDITEWRSSNNYNFEPPTTTQITNSSEEEIDKFFETLKLPQGCSFSLVPWNEVLGYQVNLKNVEYIGAVNYVAAFLDELTFFGMDEEEMLVEKEELDAICDELEEARKLPPEEQEKYFTSAKDLFEELGLEDERTQEEKELEQLQFIREIFVNQVKLFELLKYVL